MTRRRSSGARPGRPAAAAHGEDSNGNIGEYCSGDDRYAVRKAGFTSVQRAASARVPELNFPALNFEVRAAYSSSIAHPGLAAMSCLFPSRFQVTPFDNPLVWSTWPRSFGPFYSPAQRPRPSWACVPREQRASDSNCHLSGRPTGSRSSLRRLAVGGYRSVPSC